MKQSDDLGLFSALIAASAASGNVATVPDTQTTAGDGSASIALGFPPETFIDRAAGGSPPRGADMNGFLNRLSRAIQVLQAGYVGPFNSTFAQAIGGYPAGAIVSGSTPGSFWVSTADSNVTTPGVNGATWKSLFDGYLTAAIAANTYVKKSGDTMSGILNNSSWVAGGVGGGWNNNSPAVGEIVFTNGLEFGNPGNNGYFRGTWSVTDVHGNGAADQSGLNLTGYDSTGVTYQWYFAWNGRVTTPGGVLAFESDLLSYFSAASNSSNVTLTNLQGVNWTSSATNSYVQVTGNGISLAVPTVAYTSKQVSDEATLRANADTALQNNINQKVSGLAAGKIMQDFIVAVEGSGVHDITFPQAFSGVPTTIVISHGLTNGSNSPVSVLGGWTATGFQIQTNGSTSVNFLAVGPA